MPNFCWLVIIKYRNSDTPMQILLITANPTLFFIGHSLKRLLFPGGVSVFERYWKDSLYLSPDGPRCCSNFAITFQLSTSTTRMFQFYYLYYHLRAFYGGGKYGNQMAPQNKNKKSLIFQALTLDEKLKYEALEKLIEKKMLP